MWGKRIYWVFFIILAVFGLYLCSFSVLHGELNFFNDVARDFLLMQELAQKKIVLIGARSNETGLFHGPLWTYLSYPAYLIGHGNPVIVGWFWIICLTVFLITSFFIVQKLISVPAALLFILLVEVRVAPHMNGIMHALAEFMFTPLVFYSVYQYFKTKKVQYLIIHLISLTFMIQMNVGPGGSLFLLGAGISMGFIIKKRLWKHLLAFLVVPLFLVNYIIFNLRHDFIMIKPVFHLFTSSTIYVPFTFWIRNRWESTVSLLIFQDGNLHPFHFLEVFFLFVVTFSIIRIRKREHTLFYSLMMYFYFGYMLLSFINKGVILGHYVFFLFPLTILWFVSFFEKKYIWIFAPLALIVFYFNVTTSINYDRYIEHDFIGKSQYSWISLQAVARRITEKEKQNEFGYYVFSPDAFAYQPRYAMIYGFQSQHAHASEYTKKSTTYVIAAPPPPDDPYMNETWWISHQLHIEKPPIETEVFPSGYKILRYTLNDDEIAIPHDQNIELGLSFR